MKEALGTLAKVLGGPPHPVRVLYQEFNKHDSIAIVTLTGWGVHVRGVTH